jgi:tryptophanyl-tRNA synthetase
MYHDAFNRDVDEVNDLKERYVAGKVGDVEVKKKLAAAVNTLLEPMRERRAHYEARPELVKEALEKGSAEERKAGEEMMQRVREALKLNYIERGMPPPKAGA